ncbi:orf 66 [Ateline gammaherpesvirus 3]|uniref:Orf 66 n=1 Tax=Ateline herpesvirus 3 TaxID=85618 RepID=Q9YTK1_ATHV3|nr:orf 66 [Ateline gammaherpesvirus 3]AAC95590.1 orf 66 [Ateline gammaherpesvirus 3]
MDIIQEKYLGNCLKSGCCDWGNFKVELTLNSLLQHLKIDPLEFMKFVTYGGYWTIEGCSPMWPYFLDRCNTISEFLSIWCGIVWDTRRTQVHKVKLIKLTQYLFRAYLVVLWIVFPKCRADFKPRKFSENIWYKYINMPFYKAIATFMFHLNISINHPLIQFHSCFPWDLAILRKKNKPFSSAVMSLSVPAPSHRSENEELFVCPDFDEQSHEFALITALRQHGGDVPCGNPFDAMVKVLCFNSLIQNKYAIIPMDNIDKTENFDLALKVLGYNILASVFGVPIICNKIKDKIRQNIYLQQIIVCIECGHCLNFGRGKAKNFNFPPTHVFYCRDQKIKQFTVCGTSGRIYCSYCGCSQFRKFPMVESNIIRAVIANNAAYMAQCASQQFDVAVPCLGICGACIFKRVTVQSLLYLTSKFENLCCVKCSSAIQDESQGTYCSGEA